MQANMKSETAGAHTREPAPVSLLSELTRQGVEGALATQRIMLDLIMRQNATTVNALREVFKKPRVAQAEGVAEIAGEGVSNLIQAQRVLLNTALRQNEIMTNGLKERAGSPGAAVLTDLMRRSIETFIEMQQHFLRIAEKETDSWIERAKTGKNGVRNLGEILEDGIEQFVKSQKKLLDIISEEAGRAAEAGQEVFESAGIPSADIGEIMMQSAGVFVEMDKKLLDVAEKQMDLNVRVARQAIDLARPSFSLGELARQYVDNFVGAQKSMLDIIVKPRASTPREEPAKPSPRSKATRRRARASK